MKKILTIVFVMLLVIYMLPLLTVGVEGERQEQEQVQPQEDGKKEIGLALEVDKKSFDAGTSITACIDGAVTEMNLHSYLCGVLAAEMPASFPVEALKAQALAARTYTMYKIKLYEGGVPIAESHKGAQVCNDYTHCKAYVDLKAKSAEMWGVKADEYLAKITDAVSATDGILATYGGEPIAAVFHAASTEKTESAVDVWGSDYPYLQSVESPGGEDSDSYFETVKITPQEFQKKFAAKHRNADFSASFKTWFRQSRRSDAGGIIDVEVCGVRVSGQEIRSMLALGSTNFGYNPTDTEMVFTSKGYGHGVGMSQYGARKMALDGKSYDEIIKWYYKDAELTLK